MEILRVLLLIQGAIAFVSTLEGLVMAAAQGFLTAPVVLASACGAVLTLYLAARVGRRGRAVRRLILGLQLGWLLFATIDLFLTLAMAQRTLELVPIMTRIVLPVAIFRMLRRPRARDAFGVRQSRRTRRKARTFMATDEGAR